jgi:myo-inositol-1(or 4)-monophosphatase
MLQCNKSGLNGKRMANWDELTAFALTLAAASAEFILPYFRRPHRVDVKAGEVWDPVTEADRAGEATIRRMIERRFPDHGILGEEYGVKEGRSGFTWVLDPIDGTRAFICGMPTWATLIGLTVEGEPALGVMHQPFVGETFFANPEGAWSRYRDDTRKLSVRRTRSFGEATLTTTAPELYRTAAEKEALQRMTAGARLTRYGGDAYFFCLLAAGQIDVAMDARMEVHDIAPLIPIIRGAGGVVSTWSGGDPSRGGNVVAASSPSLLEHALGILGAG